MIFGGHVDRRFEVGEVVAEEGALAASSDTFAVTIRGRGAHGARPHEADDPIVGAAALVGAVQTIVSRRLDPGVAGVITVGTINAGSAPNVIPDEARLGGTIRATTAATRQRLHDELRRVASGIASAHALEIAVEITAGTPPIVNPAGPARIAADAARALLGVEAVVPFGVTNMGGEDFAFYLERMPGCFLRIGARERGGAWYAAHSPRFVAAEESLFVGAAVLAACARAASATLA
jgi:hippurate hydrolase